MITDMLLREKDKQTLLQIFSSVSMPFEVWAYGSRVNGSAHEGSDLNLVIRGPNAAAIPPDIFMSICEQIRDSNIPILVVLRDWARLPESFHKNIEERYKVCLIVKFIVKLKYLLLQSSRGTGSLCVFASATYPPQRR